MRTHLTVPAGPGRRAAAGVLVATGALLIYRATLLPALDFGDTASFQDAGGSLEITPRQAYPLYFAVGNVVVWLAGGEPAFGMNLASAICGAAACGLLAWLAADLTGSSVAGIFTGTLFAASYTFWSQAIIAEVYALHVLMLTGSVATLLWWARRPESLARLGTFFAVYALGFGNHLMMVLFAPAAVLLLVLCMPGGARALVRPRVVALALVLAAFGALQYAWNLRSVWPEPDAPVGVIETLQTFWFDVTKTDWRSTMVLGVHESSLRPRLGMYWFDLRQQFGLAGIVLAVIGAAGLAAQRWRVFACMLLAWGVAFLFAYTYNVGDAHVFFIHSHVFVALAAGSGVAGLLALARRRRAMRLAAVIALAYPSWRIVDTWPAVDRSGDTRPVALLSQLAGDLQPDRSILIADLNWQLQNGLDYYTRHLRPDIVYARASGRLLTLPWLLEANLRNGREVVLSPATAAAIARAFGAAWPIEPDPRTPPVRLADRVRALPPGSPYAIALLEAYPDIPLDADELAETASALTGGTAALPPDSVYTVMAGQVGSPPRLLTTAERPFRVRTRLEHLELDVRMEAWLPADTMRRAGFGHIIVAGRRVLVLERGVSFVALGPDGRPWWTAYASGLFAPLRRLLIRPASGA